MSVLDTDIGVLPLILMLFLHVEYGSISLRHLAHKVISPVMMRFLG